MAASAGCPPACRRARPWIHCCHCPTTFPPSLTIGPIGPDEITVRIVDGEDGRRKIQLRLDLGMLQMEFDGRPDGRRIHDCDSWFDFHLGRQKEHDRANPDSAPYLLEPEDCQELLREGVQYYHRYLSFWHLGLYELCARDTERNLRLFAFVREHARDDRVRLEFDQWRPYVTMMHARAVATPLVELEQWEAAVNVLDAGIRGIERFPGGLQPNGEGGARSASWRSCSRWKQEILEKNPPPGAARPEADASGRRCPAQTQSSECGPSWPVPSSKSGTRTRPTCATSCVGWRIRPRRRFAGSKAESIAGCRHWQIAGANRPESRWISDELARQTRQLLDSWRATAVARSRIPAASIARWSPRRPNLRSAMRPSRSPASAPAWRKANWTAAVALPRLDRHPPPAIDTTRLATLLHCQRPRPMFPLQDGTVYAARRTGRAASALPWSPAARTPTISATTGRGWPRRQSTASRLRWPIAGSPKRTRVRWRRPGT